MCGFKTASQWTTKKVSEEGWGMITGGRMCWLRLTQIGELSHSLRGHQCGDWMLTLGCISRRLSFLKIHHWMYCGRAMQTWEEPPPLPLHFHWSGSYLLTRTTTKGLVQRDAKSTFYRPQVWVCVVTGFTVHGFEAVDWVLSEPQGIGVSLSLFMYKSGCSQG